jgi:hypothetical protein
MKTQKLGTTFVVLALILVSLVQINLYSQPVTVGVKGGISIPELKGGGTPQSEGYSSRLAPNFGAFVNYELNSALSLQAEVLFSGQGGKRNGMQAIDDVPLPFPTNTTLYANFNNENIINYLEIPILLKYTFSGNETGFSEYVDAGPYLGILLNAQTKTNGNSNIYLDPSGNMPLSIGGYPLPPFDFNSNTSITSSLKTINVGIAGGVGVNLNTSAGQFDLDIRGVYGLIPIQVDKINGSNNTGALYVTIGYGLQI